MPKHVDHIIDGTELITLKRWGNTRQDVLVSLDDVNASGVISNWANTDLTFTGDRAHNTDGNIYQVTTDAGAFNGGWIYVDPNIGVNQGTWMGWRANYYKADASSTTIRTLGNQIYQTASETTLNDVGGSVDTRIEGSTDANLFFTDASTDRVGIGTNTPSYKLHVSSNGGSGYILNDVTSLNNSGFWAKNTVGSWIQIVSTSGDFYLRDATSSTNPILVEQGTPTYAIYTKSTAVTINESAQNLDFRVEGQTDANLFFVDASTDRVGIGTSSPSTSKLVISSTDFHLGLHESDTSQQWDFRVQGSFFYLRNSTSAVQPFYISNSALNNSFNISTGVNINGSSQNIDLIVKGQTDANLFFTDASTDRVGIGTNTPSHKLDIRDSSSTTAQIKSTGGASTLIIDAHTSNDAEVRFFNGGSQKWILFNDASLGDDFRLYNQGRANTDILVDGATGDFGINTATPSYQLDVNGDGRFDSGLIINDGANNSDTRIEGQTDANLFFTDASTDRVGIGTNSPLQKLHIYGDGSTTQLRVQTVTSGTASISVLDSSGGSILLRGNAADGYINHGGDFGFQTTNPAYTVDVNGDVNVRTGSVYRHNGTAGISGTYTFGGGSTGDIASMTFNGGILTAVTTVP